MYRVLCVAAAVTISACSTTQVKKNVADTPGAVVTAPTKALNINKREIPDYLETLGDPYDLSTTLTCEQIDSEITKLTEFAGPDWDSEDHYTKSGRTASELANAALPYGGIVRFISGASEHQKKLSAALGYASVRRAVLRMQEKAEGC